MQITIPRGVAAWLREPEDPDDPELLRELRIQLTSEGAHFADRDRSERGIVISQHGS